MQHDLEPRIRRMYRRDCLIAVLFVAVLVATLLFVFNATQGLVGTAGVRLVLAGSGLLLVLFNAASIFAMLRHYQEDRRFIYSLDIKHLDEYRLQRLEARAARQR